MKKRCLADFTPLSVGCNGCNGRDLILATSRGDGGGDGRGKGGGEGGGDGGGEGGGDGGGGEA